MFQISNKPMCTVFKLALLFW